MTNTSATAARRLESIPAAAAYLGVSQRTVRRYIAAGLVTGFRTGPKLIRVDRDEIDGMLRPIPNASSMGRDLHAG